MVYKTAEGALSSIQQAKATMLYNLATVFCVTKEHDKAKQSLHKVGPLLFFKLQWVGGSLNGCCCHKRFASSVLISQLLLTSYDLITLPFIVVFLKPIIIGCYTIP